MSAPAGRAGGERAQFALRLCMMPFNPLILQGPEVLVAASYEAFGDDGKLISDQYNTPLDRLMVALKAA